MGSQINTVARGAIGAEALGGKGSSSIEVTHLATSHTPRDTRGLTCKDDQPEAPLGVSQHTAAQQHILVAQGELVFLPVQCSTEFVQLIVGRFTDYFPWTRDKSATAQSPVI